MCYISNISFHRNASLIWVIFENLGKWEWSVVIDPSILQIDFVLAKSRIFLLKKLYFDNSSTAYPHVEYFEILPIFLHLEVTYFILVNQSYKAKDSFFFIIYKLKANKSDYAFWPSELAFMYPKKQVTYFTKSTDEYNAYIIRICIKCKFLVKINFNELAQQMWNYYILGLLYQINCSLKSC